MQFSDFNLPAHLLTAVKEQGYTTPTAIQEKTIPLILQGKDIIGHSETGSGKTAAFGLPLLAKLTGKALNALIITPTRELCVQVTDALKGFAKHQRTHIVAVYGGVGIGPQISAVRTADVVVATPGRLLDLMDRGLKLNNVHYLVLDEADRMLDMGFIDDVEKIFRQTPAHRQTLLFSATLSPRLRSLVHKYMKTPVSVEAKTQVDTSLLTETAYEVSSQDKFSLLAHFLKQETTGIALVFCATRRTCDKVTKNLRAQTINAIAIHGGMPQNKRMQTITTLHKRGLGVMVATDVASRGLHINNISHVYNYDLPQTPDDYVHRIGRTARAGATGDAITFVTPPDVREFRNILRTVGRSVASKNLPVFEKISMVAGPSHERSQHGSFRGRNQAGQQNRQGSRPFWKRQHR